MDISKLVCEGVLNSIISKGQETTILYVSEKLEDTVSVGYTLDGSYQSGPNYVRIGEQIFFVFDHIRIFGDVSEHFKVYNPVVQKKTNFEIYKRSIGELSAMSASDKACIKGIVRNISTISKKDGGTYAMVTIGDREEEISFPIWDKDVWQKLSPGKVFSVLGSVGFYENKVQLKVSSVSCIKEESDDPKNFNIPLPSYNISEFKQEFYDFIKNEMSLEHRAFALFCIEKHPEFFESPAAEKNHHNKLGGLFVHTFGVMKVLKAISEVYPENPDIINKSRLYLKGFLHDFMKIEEYEWESGTIKRKEFTLSHIENAVAFVKYNAPFESKEVINICNGILAHHGQWGKHEPKNLEDILLHQADMIDSRCFELIEKK